MADAEEKARQEKIAAARKRVEEMKKKRGIKSGSDKKEGTKEGTKDDTEESTKDSAKEPADENDSASAEPADPPSIAQQSKLRSSSFRAGSLPVSPAPFSPDGDTAPDIYRKHVARIEELEKENKRLAKEAADSERRWNKAEESLSELREAETRPKGDDGLTEKLENEVASLQRQNAQLQQQASRGHHRLSVSSPLQAELDSKTATIESMEIEISRLKARVERQETGASSEREQVTALEEKLARAEAAAGKAQRELQDAKRNLERATEKAVREGGERSSAETKAKTLESELADVKAAKDEAHLRIEAMEKKVATLTTLHREQDSRSQALRKDKERAEKELSDLRAKMEKLESDNLRLRSRKSVEGGGGLDDEGVDELEDEERLKLEKKIRSLEREVHELRSGVWIEKRREMETGSFQDVDLGSAQPKKAGFGELIASGFNALAGGGEDDLMDDDFDEDAFRKAQQEEGRKRLERIKENVTMSDQDPSLESKTESHSDSSSLDKLLKEVRVFHNLNRCRPASLAAASDFLAASHNHSPYTEDLLPMDEANERIELAIKAETAIKEFHPDFEFTSIHAAIVFNAPLNNLRTYVTEPGAGLTLRRAFRSMDQLLQSFTSRGSHQSAAKRAASDELAGGSKQSQGNEQEKSKPRSRAESKKSKDRDQQNCVITGHADPEACHIIPFTWINTKEKQERNGYLLEPASAILLPEDDVRIATRLVYGTVGATDKAWNMISLNPTLHQSWGRYAFGLKWIGQEDLGNGFSKATIQFHWLPAPEKLNSTSRINVQELRSDWLDKVKSRQANVACHHLSSNQPVLSGDTFALELPTAHVGNFEIVIKVQWALVKIGAMAGAANDPRFHWQHDGPDRIENWIRNVENAGSEAVSEMMLD
ncbi:hypothetical protein CDD80_3370 [Ophiocordyceps camponoti-rufipedis]|uniref:HNH nuclease domain-containing protein n=1 Tax=Ophiocordyceps camponoti-rufipedis TaxID=2004952 RepID=A0A2C5YSL0_9HYPO|nr:hypothetical protein CDD80_3370 [Ophiocordyceps camponoti-rufipedis]